MENGIKPPNMDDLCKKSNMSAETDLDEAGITKWNSAYKIEHSSVLWSEPPVPYIAQSVIPRFKEAQAQHIMDLPCGDGRHTIPLAQNFRTVIGCDSSENALRILAGRLRGHGISNCLLQREDIFSVSYCSEQLDAILCWDLIGHLQKSKEALTELLRILKPNGLLIVSIFAMEDSTRGKDMRPMGESAREFVYLDKFFFRFYNHEDARSLATILPVSSFNIDLTTWTEPPHEGYREYSHEHASHILILRK